MTETENKLKVLYTAEATSTGGRRGHARTSDGRLEVDFSSPTELGGDGGPGTNPEQQQIDSGRYAFQGADRVQPFKGNIEIGSRANAPRGINALQDGMHVAREPNEIFARHASHDAQSGDSR